MILIVIDVIHVRLIRIKRDRHYFLMVSGEFGKKIVSVPIFQDICLTFRQDFQHGVSRGFHLG